MMVEVCLKKVILLYGNEEKANKANIVSHMCMQKNRKRIHLLLWNLSFQRSFDFKLFCHCFKLGVLGYSNLTQYKWS